MLVEIWVVVAGFILPVIRWLKRQHSYTSNQWQYWVHPPIFCFSAALFFIIVRIARAMDAPELQEFGDSEVREFAVATFLALYLASFLVKLRCKACQSNK